MTPDGSSFSRHLNQMFLLRKAALTPPPSPPPRLTNRSMALGSLAMTAAASPSEDGETAPGGGPGDSLRAARLSTAPLSLSPDYGVPRRGNPPPPRGFRVLAPALRLPLKRAQQCTQAINLHCSLESHYQATAMRLAAERRAATSRTGALSKPANDGEEVRSAVSAGLRYEQPSPWKKGINRVSAASQPQQMAEDRKEGARRAAQRRDAWTRPIMTGSWPHQPCRALKEETEIDGTPIMTPH